MIEESKVEHVLEKIMITPPLVAYGELVDRSYVFRTWTMRRGAKYLGDERRNLVNRMQQLRSTTLSNIPGRGQSPGSTLQKAYLFLIDEPSLTTNRPRKSLAPPKCDALCKPEVRSFHKGVIRAGKRSCMKNNFVIILYRINSSLFNRFICRRHPTPSTIVWDEHLPLGGASRWHHVHKAGERQHTDGGRIKQ